MASARAESGNAAVAPQVCAHCRKSFPRLCDLNKHAKSHSRPFKCSVMNCKYHKHGWPTAKELERHVNDKHSLAPRTFPCLFPSCTYESKRESNCKQHMEKKHGWQYVRSKSNSKQLTSPARVGADPPVPKPSDTEAHPSSTMPFLGPDFVLYPDDADQSMVLGDDEEDLTHVYEGLQQDGSRVFIPWTSPATRLLKNQSVLDMFSQTYNSAPNKGLGHSDVVIDPSLSQYDHLPAPPHQRLNDPRLSAVVSSVKVEPPSTAADRSSWNGESETGSMPGESPSERRNPSSAYSSQLHTPLNGGLDYAGPPLQASQMGWTPPKLRRRGSEDDGHPPEKKLKQSPPEDFTDTNMPDIFRFAHPLI